MSQNKQKLHLGIVLTAAHLFCVQLMRQVTFLAGQNLHLLPHAVHLTPDLLCIALKSAAHVTSKQAVKHSHTWQPLLWTSQALACFERQVMRFCSHTAGDFDSSYFGAQANMQY